MGGYAHNPFGSSNPSPDPLSQLIKSLEKAIGEFADHHRQRTDWAQAGQLYLDFSRNELTRPNRSALPLPNSVVVRMLEMLARTGRLSVTRFLLLDRFTPSTGHTGRRHLFSAFRHELTMLRRLVAQLDLPVEIKRDAGGIRAAFDTSRLRTNLEDGRRWARESALRLEAADFPGAARVAESALNVDGDCVAAASVVAQILQVNEGHVGLSAVMRSQFCLGRAIVRCTRCVRRLPERSSVPEITKARRTAQRLLVRLDRRWNTLLSWPFDQGPSRSSDVYGDFATRDFLVAWVKSLRGDVLAFDRFVTSPVTVTLIDQLLEKRPIKGRIQKRKEVAEELVREVFEKLFLSWLPAPAMSQEELVNQLRSFLSRRVDWQTLLGRVASDTAVLREDTCVLRKSGQLRRRHTR